MAKVSEFIKESYVELTQKVTWPTWGELWSSSILVLVTSLIIAFIIAAMDQGVNAILHQFYKSLT